MCLNPRKGWLVKDFWDNKKLGGPDRPYVEPFVETRVVFNEMQARRYDVVLKEVTIPCGHCIECKKAYTNQWVLRCQAELKQHQTACFLTLTYNKEHNPIVLVKKDFQDFMKRLREYLREKYGVFIRFFACGEYGSKKQRPHYHVIIFGWCPPDLQYFYTDKGIDIYLSSTVEKIWGQGFITVGIDMSSKAMRYTVKYLQKGNYKSLPIHPVTGEQVRPFTLMSRRPGIGANIELDSNAYDLDTGKLYLDGQTIPLPRYYIQRAERSGVDLEELKLQREQYQKLLPERSNSTILALREQYVKKFGFWTDENFSKFFEEYY